MAPVATAIASGNDGSTSQISAPGCISTAVTVGSTTDSDTISYFSNMSNVVDLVAAGGGAPPGTNILSSIPTVGGSTTTYADFQGTSMATPHVAGAFAAIRSACPTKTIAEILAALQSTGLSVTDTRSGGTITKPRIRVGLAVQQLACGGTTTATATHDFNGDGKSDILWRDTSGNVAIWLMNGTSSIGGGGIVGVVPVSWSIVGTGDFNGDGKSDILWRDTSGNVAIWLMNGTSSIGGGGIVGVVPVSWSIVETGDFNGDGKSDILWRNTSGNTAVWFMNGTTSIGGGSLGVVSTDWTIQGLNAD